MSLPLLLQIGNDSSAVTYDIREAIVARLLSLSTITDIVGQRVRPDASYQGETEPTLTLTVTENDRGHWLTGASGMTDARVEFEGRTRLKSQAVALKRALENAFDGWRGTVLGIVVVWASQESEIDISQPAGDGSADRYYTVSVEYRFKYRSQIPAF